MERVWRLFLRKEERSRVEETLNSYSYPVPKQEIVRTIEQTTSHKGEFEGAVDFVVGLGTPIFCPFEGEVVRVVDTNDKFGPTKDFAPYLNYVTIRHANGEYSQPAHLAKDSALVKVGDRVIPGQQIGITGNSGWMTEPHLHFFVFRSTPGLPGFVGLKIRFKND